MTLIEIKNYMMSVKIATLGNLCTRFNAEAEMIRCLLSHWIRKGNVRRCTKEPACGSKCFKCPTTTTEIYEWVPVVSLQSRHPMV